MAKRIILVENAALRKLCGSDCYSATYETEGAIYGCIGGILDQPKETSPRPVDRDHFRREFQSELNDLETVLRNLKDMKAEI